MVARLTLILGLFVGLLFILVPDTSAQSGNCPSWTNEIGTAGGTWPGSTKACEDASLSNHVAVSGAANHPCDQQYRFYNLIYGAFQQRKPILYIVPPDGYDLGSLVRMKFMIYQDPVDFGAAMPENTTIHLKFYDAGGVLKGGTSIPLHNSDDVTIIAAVWDGPVVDFVYDVYIVDTAISVGTGNHAGGYATMMVDPGQIYETYYVASIQSGSYWDTFPMSCTSDDWNPPPTPTLMATWTPQPEATPDGTTTPGATAVPGSTSTPVSFPTSVNGTAFPVPTEAPVVFPTIPSESLPTPWPPYTIAPISFPAIPTTVGMSVDNGGDDGNGGGAVPTLQSNDPSSMVTRISAVTEGWQESVDFGIAAADPSISSTTGLAAPANIVPVISENIGLPISYFKTLMVYMPNAAPYLAVLLLMAAWVLFNVMAKPMIGIAKVVIEIIRRLWEAIPLN